MNGKCPICARERGPFGENEFFPFCCARCRLIDLGRWLGEEYFIPDDDASAQVPEGEDE